MSEQVTLQVDYAALDELQQRPAAWWQDVLAVVCFDCEPITPPLGGIPTPQVTATVLGASDRRAEIWRLPGPLSSGQLGRVHYRRAERLLFASLCIHEDEFGAAAGATTKRLRAATAAAYREMFHALQSLGFAHPLRFWNYMPAINDDSGGTERYWHFNRARRQAFLGAQRSIGGNVPAASALGTSAGSALTVYCIAGVQPPIALENPRQCSPWQYPPRYGPRPPTFARACLESQGAQTLFISGTASIVGHRSEHAGDPAAQTRETLSNIRALIDVANLRLGQPRHTAQRLRYKVYVRWAADQPDIEQELRRSIGDEAQVLFLQADICRRELLVEIEAVGL